MLLVRMLKNWKAPLVLVVLSLAIAGCGGDDDDGNGDDAGTANGGTTAGESPTASDAGNGDGGNGDTGNGDTGDTGNGDGGNGNGGGGGGGDEAYVRGVCSALTDLQTSIEEMQPAAQGSGNVEDLNNLLGEMAGIFDNAVSDLEGLNPPDDVEESHNQITSLMRQIAEALEGGDFAALSEFNPDVTFEPPADVQARLQSVAENVEECQQVGVF